MSDERLDKLSGEVPQRLHEPTYMCHHCRDTSYMCSIAPGGEFNGWRCPHCRERVDQAHRDRFNHEQQEIQRQAEYEERATRGQAGGRRELGRDL